MAVGVARPIAQGQAMITTPMNEVRARVRRGSGPKRYQPAKVRRATARTPGTKTSLIRSARRWIGALDPWACSTSDTIRASAVSAPTRVARKANVPVVLTVAPKTSSPTPLATGIGSPVSIASSTADVPSMTTPSTGTRSPGRTRSRSPGWISSIGTERSPPGSIRSADVAWRWIRRRIAPLARVFARASSQRPRTTRPRTMVELSK